jgi:hypothetical protein
LTSIEAAATLVLVVVRASFVTELSRSTSVIEATLVVVVWLLRASLSHTGHQLLDDAGDVVHVSSIDRALTTLLKMALEVLFVFIVLVLEVAILFNLVVVNIKGSVVYDEVLGVFSGLSLIGCLVANESVRALAVLRLKDAQ